jgi:hypothetical protein
MIAGNNFVSLKAAKRPVNMYSWSSWAAPSPDWTKIGIMNFNNYVLFTTKRLDITTLKIPD